MTNHIGSRVTHPVTLNTGVVNDQCERTGLGDLDGTWVHVKWADGFTCWIHSSSVTIWTNRPNVVALCD